jgi:hypothetical protein
MKGYFTADEVRTFASWGINWIWYLRVQFIDDDTVDVLAHYRCHKGEEGHPKTSPGDFTLVRSEKLNQYISVMIGRKEYLIRNYKD